MDSYLNVLGMVAATVCVIGLAGLFVFIGVALWNIIREGFYR